MANGLTKHQLEIISKAVLSENRRQYDENKKEEKIRNLRNTEILLKNYRKLKALCDEALQEAIPANYPEFSLETLTLESLTVYRKKTLMMMNHVDKMLVAYEWACRQGSVEEQRRFKVLKLRYLADIHLSIKEIVELHKIDQSTVYRDTKQAINDMSVLLFGLDALNFK